MYNEYISDINSSFTLFSDVGESFEIIDRLSSLKISLALE